MIQKPTLSVKDLKVHYPVREPGFFKAPSFLKAVDGVSFDLAPGEVLGLVGESGCGKSSLGKALLRLAKPTAGSVLVSGTDFLGLEGEKLRAFRPQIQMVFQDPFASLNPRMTVYETLKEPLRAHFQWDDAQMKKKILETVEQVGLAKDSLDKYPHEFSGGQRQRIAIARALILDPQVIVADEPVSSLDVSVQAQVLNLFKRIQKERNLSLLFISHNLSVVNYLCDRIAVMYLGKIVELSERKSLFESPQHPYTQALISAVPVPDPQTERARQRIKLEGEVPSAKNPPPGCAFSTRCSWVKPHCLEKPPELLPSEPGSHQTACFEVK